MDSDVVVVGAGLSGLMTARHLVAAGLSVVVLEAQHRVGGRTLDHRFADGTVVELGGQWVGPTQDRVLTTIAELGLELFATHDAGEALALVDGRLLRSARGNPLGPSARSALAEAFDRLEAMAETVPLGAPWTCPESERWDSQTFATYLRSTVVEPTARTYLELVTRAVFAAEPSDLSLLHFLFYVHSGGMFPSLLSTREGAQESRIVGGSQQICGRLAASLGERVQLSAPVRSIAQDDLGVTVAYAGGDVRARRVVVTTPPTMAARIRFDPPLTGARDQLLQKMPMGAVIKAMARYDRPFWRSDGLSGSALSLDGHAASLVFDNSPPDGSCGVLLAFVEGWHARRLGRLDAGAQEEAIVADLAAYFGEQAREAQEFVCRDWAAEEWTRGCYGAHLAPGVWTQYGDELRRPHGAVHWAGTETAEIWNGYLDGAVRSADRAAAEVMTAFDTV